MNLQMVTASNTINQLQKRIDTISNNIANINTVGFKRSEATFQELLTQSIKNQPHGQKEMGRSTPFGVRVGHGMMIGQTTMRYEQGAPQETGRPLDVMIEGESTWFRTARNWVDEEGNQRTEEYFTRNGAFQLQPDVSGGMKLVTNQGLSVLDSNGREIIVGPNSGNIQIDGQGNLVATNATNGQTQTFRLGLAAINRPDLLEPIGESQFRLAGNVAELEANGGISFQPINYNVRQGALEMANVDLSQEMTELMVSQRLLQFQSRSISIADDMMGVANSIRG
jgi:flagellar basal-body rod protein FlgG